MTANKKMGTAVYEGMNSANDLNYLKDSSPIKTHDENAAWLTSRWQPSETLCEELSKTRSNL